MMTPSDYLHLFESCQMTSDAQRLKQLDYVTRVILTHQTIYQTVQRFVSIPWPLIAAIHFRESDQNFTKHLHNGDSLLARTVHVPKGRPALGQPPFTWIESAVDALDETWQPSNWGLASCLEFLERYNGLGYQKHGVNSPYLWDFTNQYVSGLYEADGVFVPNKFEKRPGCVAILKTLVEKGVSLDFTHLEGRDSSLH